MAEPKRTNKERQALRDFYLERESRHGFRLGLMMGKSLRCQNGDHECKNTGENCLCICHDVIERSNCGGS